MDNQHCTFAELKDQRQRTRKVRAGTWFQATTMPAPLELAAPEPFVVSWPSWVFLAAMVAAFSLGIATLIFVWGPLGALIVCGGMLATFVVGGYAWAFFSRRWHK